VHKRRRSQKSINDRHRSTDYEAPPSFRNRCIYADDPPAETHGHLPEPPIKGISLCGVMGADPLNTLPNFAKCQDTEKNLIVIHPGPPRSNIRVAARPFSDLRKNVGIEQPGHNSTIRLVSELRTISMPSSGAAESSALKLTLAFD
jgi:hypothetical protein